MAELKDVIDTLDNAADSFDGIATKEQKKIYDEVVSLAKDLKTKNGKVIQSIENLKLLTKIKAHLAALSKDKEWVAGITQFAQYFGHLQKMQNEYYSQHFTESTLGMDFKKKNELMRKMAVQNTMEALMGDGLKANVTDKLNDILLRAVTSGSKFADLQHELHAHLMGENGGKGAFARYATTYATTALSQFAGQHNKLVTDDLGLEWFMYTGSNKETTREFCEHLTEKKYIHKSEIPTILTGKIDDHQCAIYDKTGLPLGMIAGTTPENFQCNCGGWNCRHQLVPVHELAVPANIRAKFKQIKPTAPTQQEPKKGNMSIDLTQYKEQISNIEQYIAGHPGSKKLKNYLANIHKIAADGSVEDLQALLKAAKSDISKFLASEKANKKNKAAKEAQAEWQKLIEPLQADLHTINQYTINHPGSSKIANYYIEIFEELEQKDPSLLPHIMAVIKAAIKDIKKFNASANSPSKKGKKAAEQGTLDSNDADVSLPVSKQNSYKEDNVQKAQKAVLDTIEKWLKKFGYKDWASAPAAHKKAKLEQEINWLISNKSQYPDTWEIAKNIYQRMLADADKEEKYINIQTQINELKAYKTKNQFYKDSIRLAEIKLAKGEYDKAQLYINNANDIRNAEEAKKNAGKSKINPSKNENKTEQNEHIGEGYSTSKRVNLIMEQTGCSKKKAEDWNAAVFGFSYEWDFEIRAVQSGNTNFKSRHGHTIEDIKKKAQDIEDFLSKSPKWAGGTIYRGMTLSPKEVDAFRKDLKAGRGNMLGGSSWSTRLGTAKRFAGYHTGETSVKYGDIKTKFVICICDNTKNATSIKHLSHFPNEDEVYSSMANRYKFISEKDDGTYIYFTVSCV